MCVLGGAGGLCVQAAWVTVGRWQHCHRPGLTWHFYLHHEYMVIIVEKVGKGIAWDGSGVWTALDKVEHSPTRGSVTAVGEGPYCNVYHAPSDTPQRVSSSLIVNRVSSTHPISLMVSSRPSLTLAAAHTFQWYSEIFLQTTCSPGWVS
jgi:hypothetical protein